jgi:hypothetical protein
MSRFWIRLSNVVWRFSIFIKVSGVFFEMSITLFLSLSDVENVIWYMTINRAWFEYYHRDKQEIIKVGQNISKGTLFDNCSGYKL